MNSLKRSATSWSIGWRGLQAEFENARKRAERERQEFRDFAVGNVVEQFLPVLDNFELALKATGSAEQLRSGVELIVKQMEEILRQLQVQRGGDGGRANSIRGIHEALGTVERDGLARSARGRGDSARLQAARAAAASGAGARGLESEADKRVAEGERYGSRGRGPLGCVVFRGCAFERPIPNQKAVEQV